MLLEKHNTQSEESESPELFNAKISALLFADDLALFSLTKNGLQEKLRKYFRQWHLNLNLKKTKVVIFIIFLYDRKLKIVWKRISIFFKQRVSIIL